MRVLNNVFWSCTVKNNWHLKVNTFSAKKIQIWLSNKDFTTDNVQRWYLKNCYAIFLAMETKKIDSLIREIEKSLSPISPDTMLCHQYAWWTLQAITGKDQAHLLAQDEITLTRAQEEKLRNWIDRMVNQNEPIQYLLGSVPFNDIEILVQPPTLIPRPETEEWVINVIAQLKKLKNQCITILDLCSGSGCIALAIAQALPNSTVFATDISEEAILLARHNAQHNKIKNVTFVHTDLFDALPTDTLFDLIVSNPPYISMSEFQELDSSVSSWEDPQALVAADDGLAIINDIIEIAPDFLQDNAEMKQLDIPQLVIEIGYTQAHKTIDLLQSFGFAKARIIKDLEGKDRVAYGRID